MRRLASRTLLALATAASLVAMLGSAAADGHDGRPPGDDGTPHEKDPPPPTYYVSFDPDNVTYPSRGPLQNPCKMHIPRPSAADPLAPWYWPLPACVSLSTEGIGGIPAPATLYAYHNSTAGTYGVEIASLLLESGPGGREAATTDGAGGGGSVTVTGKSGLKKDCHYCPPPPALAADCLVIVDELCMTYATSTESRQSLLP